MHHPHTTDASGFDYMANTGKEEQDRDTVGIVFSLAIMGFIVGCHYFGLL